MDYTAKDEQLYIEVQRMMAGDFSNYEAFYNLSMNYIYKIIFDIVKDYETTQDLLQETYIRIYNSISQLQDPRAFFAWAGRIATNLTFRHLRKYRLETLAYANEEGELEYFFDRASEDQEAFIPEDILVMDSSRKIIADIIDSLSPEQKIAVQYYYFEDMSVGEIAQAMECSEGTIKSRLNYARNAIKKAVLSIEQTQGIRLHSMAAFPILWYVFRESAETFFHSPGATATVGTIGVSGYANTLGSVGAAGYDAMGTVGAGGVNNAAVGAGSINNAVVGATGVGTGTSIGTSGIGVTTGLSLGAKIAIAAGGLLAVGGISVGAIHIAQSHKKTIETTTIETTVEATQEAEIVETTEEVTTEEVVEEIDEVELYKAYVKEVLIPEYGLCMEGQQVKWMEGVPVMPEVYPNGIAVDEFSLGGIESVLIDDLDNDGFNEMLAIRLVETNEEDAGYTHINYEQYLCLYGLNGNSVELYDERTVSVTTPQSTYEITFSSDGGTYNHDPGTDAEQFALINTTDKKYILATHENEFDGFTYINMLMTVQDKKIVSVAAISSNGYYEMEMTTSATDKYVYENGQMSTITLNQDIKQTINDLLTEYGLNVEIENEFWSTESWFGFVKTGANVQILLETQDRVDNGYGANSATINNYTDFREW